MNLKQKAINSTKWSSISTIVRTLTQVIRLAILARFLQPTDFGLFAVVLMVLAFTNIFSDFGINVAILHKQEISRDEYSSLYWFNILISLGLFGFILCLTPIVAYFYDQPLLKILIPFTALDLIITAIGRQQLTILQKQLNFKIIAIVDITASVFSLIIASFTAFNGFGVYSIIISALSLSTIRTALLIIFVKHKIELHCKFKETFPFLRIGIYQTGAQMLDYVSNYTDIFLIGRFFSIEQLGFYTLAKELIIKPYQIINSTINTVSISYLSRLQSNLKQLSSNYLKIVTAVSFINFPIYCFLICFALSIVRIYYGNSYDNVAHFVSLLGVWGLFASINALIGNITFAMGRTDLNFKWTIVRVCINPLVIIFTCFISLEALAIGQSALGTVFLFLSWLFILNKLTKISWKGYYTAFIKSLILSVTLALIVWLLYIYIHVKSDIINLILYAILFFGTYFILSYLFNKNIKESIHFFKNIADES